MRGYHLGREPYHIQYYVIKCQKLNVEVLRTLYNNVHLFYRVYQVYLMGDKAIMERDLWITNSPFITRLRLDWITQNYRPIHSIYYLSVCETMETDKCSYVSLKPNCLCPQNIYFSPNTRHSRIIYLIWLYYLLYRPATRLKIIIKKKPFSKH